VDGLIGPKGETISTLAGQAAGILAEPVVNTATSLLSGLIGGIGDLVRAGLGISLAAPIIPLHHPVSVCPAHRRHRHNMRQHRKLKPRPSKPRTSARVYLEIW